MIETRIEVAKHAQGTVKETGGKVVAEVKLRAEGKGDQAEGDVAACGRQPQGHSPQGCVD